MHGYPAAATQSMSPTPHSQYSSYLLEIYQSWATTALLRLLIPSVPSSTHKHTTTAQKVRHPPLLRVLQSLQLPEGDHWGKASTINSTKLVLRCKHWKNFQRDLVQSTERWVKSSGKLPGIDTENSPSTNQWKVNLTVLLPKLYCSFTAASNSQVSLYCTYLMCCKTHKAITSHTSVWLPRKAKGWKQGCSTCPTPPAQRAPSSSPKSLQT